MGNAIVQTCQWNTLSIQVPKDSDSEQGNTESSQPAKLPRSQLRKHKSIADFTLNSKLGQGGFGAVYRATQKSNNNEFAIKVIKKSLFRDSLRVQDILNEKNIMTNAFHPFIVRLHYAFQDKRNIYYAMDFVKGGMLLRYMRRLGCCSEEVVRFYIAQIILALKYLHEDKKIVYRDLKPENILIDEQGYIKLIDFGLSAMGVERLTSICGTYEYIAPEILRGEEYSEMVDYFSLGCLMYEMLTGSSPFNTRQSQSDSFNVIRNILKNNYEFDPDMVISAEARDLINKLLNPDPSERLGFKGAVEIQSHEFFKTVDWDKLYQKEITAPIQVDIYTGYEEKKYRIHDTVKNSGCNIFVKGLEYSTDEEENVSVYAPVV